MMGLIRVNQGCAAQSKKIQLMTATLGGNFSGPSLMRAFEAITAMPENIPGYHEEAFCPEHAKPYSIRGARGL
jgi:hypothetical protein